MRFVPAQVVACMHASVRLLCGGAHARAASSGLCSKYFRWLATAPLPDPGASIVFRHGAQPVWLGRRSSNAWLDHAPMHQFLVFPTWILAELFASLMLEQRVLLVSKSLNTLSETTFALVACLQPFVWNVRGWLCGAGK